MHPKISKSIIIFKKLIFLFILFFLLFAVSLINIYLTPKITVLCDFYEASNPPSISNSTLHLDVSREECESQRRATVLFIVFCLVRLISNKFEDFVGAHFLHTCSVRSTFPGRHFGAALGFPYLTRSLSTSIRVASAPIFLVIIFTSTSIAFYPYAKDFAKLCKLIYNAVQRRHYLYNRSMMLTFVSIYFYFSTVLIELLDVSFGIYCQQTIFGLSILFPNFNFPLFLFLLHTTILHHHKAMPAIIYEVNNEDCFIQLNRMRCITNKDCPQMSSAFPLDVLPSKTTTIQRRRFEGRIIQIRQYRELDDILPCKVSTQVRKISTFSSKPPSLLLNAPHRAPPSTVIEIE